MSKKQSNKKNPDSAGQNRRVWRIFHFEHRFEMDSYRRQGGLDYVRMFVTATTQDKSNESSGFIQQLSELEHYYPDMRDALEGRFWRLCRLTATQEDWLRGYLLDAEQKPLTTSRMAARLHLSLADMKKTLTALKRVGLIEQVDCPEFEKPKRKKQEKDEQENQNTGRSRRTKRGDNRRKTKKKAAVSKRSETFRNVPESLNNKIESKKNNLKKENEQKKEKQIPTKGDQTAHSPTTAPPGSSTMSDVPGVIGPKSRRNSPRAPVNAKSIGDTLELVRFRYSSESLGFADQMLVRIGMVREFDLERIRSGTMKFTNEQANERAHWAKAWDNCIGRFGADDMDKLRQKIFKRADTIRASPAGIRNPRAYLMTSWNNLLCDVMRKCKAI